MGSPVPWSRLLAEGVVVVGSILIAFAVDAWWDGQKSIASEQTFLSNLAVGLEENARMAAAAAEAASADRALLQRFVAMTPDEAGQIPSDSTWLMLRALFRPTAAELNSAAVVALLESSPTLLRSDPALRTALATWQGGVASLAKRTDMLRGVSDEVIHALSAHSELQPAFAQLEGARALPGSVTRSVREDNEVMRLAVHKGFNTQIQILIIQIVGREATAALESLRAYQGPSDLNRGAS